MAQALIDTGVKWFGADASRQPQQYELGGALSVPRHPTGIYYNVGTRDGAARRVQLHQLHGLPAPATSAA